MPDGVAPFIGALGLGVLVLSRNFSARQIALRHQGRYVWLLYAPTIIGALAIVWSGGVLLARGSVGGIVILAFGLFSIVEDPAAIGVRRFYADDPFGNRLELVDRRDGGFTVR